MEGARKGRGVAGVWYTAATPMQKPFRNYAFIDAQNLHLGMRRLGWRLHYARFRRYLREKYGVERAYMFLGFVASNQGLYQSLQSAGYQLVFKQVIHRPDGKPKGNVDAELVLQAMIDLHEYERAVIVTSDGDFACLVNYLREQQKLHAVMSPEREKCSALLKKAARQHLVPLSDLRQRLEYKK